MEKGESSKRVKHGSMVGVLASGPLGNITSRTDLLSTGRIARGVPEVRRSIEEDPSLSFGSPCLLHMESPQPFNWSDLRYSEVFHFVLVDHPMQCLSVSFD